MLEILCALPSLHDADDDCVLDRVSRALPLSPDVDDDCVLDRVSRESMESFRLFGALICLRCLPKQSELRVKLSSSSSELGSSIQMPAAEIAGGGLSGRVLSILVDFLFWILEDCRLLRLP